MPLKYTKFKKDKKMKKAILSAAVLLALSGCSYLSMEKGTNISQATMEQIVVNKSTQSDVERIIGYPQNKQKLGDGEIWYYEFSKVGYLGNKDEKTVFEFDKKGVVGKKYKTGGNSKNPLTGK